MQYGAAWTIGSSYDANGNLTSDGSTSFTYDMENRLVAASGAKGANLRYDPLGRLYEVNGPFGLTRFVYDGDHVTAEYNSAGTVLRRYMWGPSADEPILWDEGSAVNCSGGKFLHPNRQGSVVAAADCAGALIGINKYDEYGIPQSGNTGRFQYTGQAWLPELGMYYYKARIYSPTLGRFLQTDPIGYKDQFNLYAYVGNDPVNRSDPSGLAKVCTAVTGSHIQACVGVDGNGDGNVKDNDLTSGKKSKLGSDFHGAIVANNGRNISGFGKPVSNDASNPATSGQMAMTRAVTQFVGASVRGDEAALWANVDRVWTSGAHFFGRPNEFVRDALTSPSRGQIVLGQNPGWFSGSLYNHPSDLARVLLHEMGHAATPLGFEGAVDAQARRLLKQYGLDGGGCSAVGMGGFGGSWIPGMLKRIILLATAVCSGCNSNLGQYAYCSESSEYKLYFDFQHSVIRILGRDGQSQDTLRISPCSENPKYCFTGDISLINPFFVKSIPHPKVAKILFSSNNSIASVEISDVRSLIKYEIGRGMELPDRIEFVSSEGFANGRYSRCGR